MLRACGLLPSLTDLRVDLRGEAIQGDTLPPLPELRRLQIINTRLSNLNCLQHVKKLSWLRISRLDGLVDLEGIPSDSNIRLVDISDCRALTSVDSLATLPKLQNLIISGCRSLAHLPRFAHPDSLRSVSLEWTGVRSLESLTPLQKLQFLRVNNTTGVHSGLALEQLTVLRRLDLSVSSARSTLRFHPLHMTDLRISGRVRSDEFATISECHRLKLLSVERLSGSDCSALAGMSSLQSLTVADGWTLKSLNGLEALTSLRSLRIEDGGFSDLSPIAHCHALERLQLDNCSDLADLTPLEGLRNLNYLSLRDSVANLDADDIARIESALPNLVLEYDQLGFVGEITS
jgi:Leucine-rich repeat (LRR) protein